MRILFWPFRFIWMLIGLLFGVMGRLLTAIVGLVLILAGLILTFTLIGAIVGIPLLIFGCLLTVRSLF